MNLLICCESHCVFVRCSRCAVRGLIIQSFFAKWWFELLVGCFVRSFVRSLTRLAALRCVAGCVYLHLLQNLINIQQNKIRFSYLQKPFMWALHAGAHHFVVCFLVFRKLREPAWGTRAHFSNSTVYLLKCFGKAYTHFRAVSVKPAEENSLKRIYTSKINIKRARSRKLERRWTANCICNE